MKSNLKMQRIKLGDVLEVLTDYHANGAYEKLKGNVELLDEENYAVMIRTTNFESNKFSENLKFITKDAYNFLNKSKVYPGDLIMNKIANAGSIYLMPDLGRPISLAMNLFLLRINQEKVNPVYVYVYLKINERYVKEFANGSVTKTITKAAVRSLEIAIPSREVQDEIAELYLAISARIDLLENINRTIGEISGAFFKSWFSDYAPTHRMQQHTDPNRSSELIDKLFPNQFESTETEFGDIPKGWQVTKIIDLLTFKKGVEPGRKNYFDKPDDGLVPFVRVGDLSSRNSNLFVSRDAYKEFLVKNEDILLSTDGNIGIVTYGFEGTISGGIRKVTYLNGSSGPFVAELLKSRIFQNLLEINTPAETTIKHAGTALPKIRMPIPTAELIAGFDDAFYPLFERTISNKKKVKILSRLRDVLFPKLLSGEVELNFQIGLTSSEI